MNLLDTSPDRERAATIQRAQMELQNVADFARKNGLAIDMKIEPGCDPRIIVREPVSAIAASGEVVERASGAAHAVLVELLYLRELQASYMRHKQRRACSPLRRDSDAIEEVTSMKAELDRRTPAAWDAARAIAALPAGDVGAGWQPIETAPKDEAVLVYTPPQPGDWPDSDRMELDCLCSEDDAWHNHSEHYEHFMMIGGSRAAGPDMECTGPSERAPYTHWLRIPAAPSPIATQTSQAEGQEVRG